MPTYLYRYFDRAGQLLYVGITDDVERRKREHAKDKHWWPEVSRTSTMAFDRRVEALWAEWGVITSCAPVYNKSATPPTAPDVVDQPFIVKLEKSSIGNGVVAHVKHWHRMRRLARNPQPVGNRVCFPKGWRGPKRPGMGCRGCSPQCIDMGPAKVAA